MNDFYMSIVTFVFMLAFFFVAISLGHAATTTHDKLPSYELCIAGMEITERRIGMKGETISNGPEKVSVTRYRAADGDVVVTCGPYGDVWVTQP